MNGLGGTPWAMANTDVGDSKAPADETSDFFHDSHATLLRHDLWN
jgi:hypothetical protein